MEEQETEVCSPRRIPHISICSERKSLGSESAVLWDRGGNQVVTGERVQMDAAPAVACIVLVEKRGPPCKLMT